MVHSPCSNVANCSCCCSGRNYRCRCCCGCGCRICSRPSTADRLSGWGQARSCVRLCRLLCRLPLRSHCCAGAVACLLRQLLRHGGAVCCTHATAEEATQPVLLLLLLLLLLMMGGMTPDWPEVLGGVTGKAIVPAVPPAGRLRVGAALCMQSNA